MNNDYLERARQVVPDAKTLILLAGLAVAVSLAKMRTTLTWLCWKSRRENSPPILTVPRTIS